jgi:hypothetical protein
MNFRADKDAVTSAAAMAPEPAGSEPEAVALAAKPKSS